MGETVIQFAVVEADIAFAARARSISLAPAEAMNVVGVCPVVISIVDVGIVWAGPIIPSVPVILDATRQECETGCCS
jgi:hypothetical protein